MNGEADCFWEGHWFWRAVPAQLLWVNFWCNPDLVETGWSCLPMGSGLQMTAEYGPGISGPAHPLIPGITFQDLTWILFLNISFLFPYATMKTADVNKNSSCQCNTESTVCGYFPAAAFTAQYGTNTFPYLHCRLQLPRLAQEEWATAIKTSVPQNWELIF